MLFWTANSTAYQIDDKIADKGTPVVKVGAILFGIVVVFGLYLKITLSSR